MEETVRIAITDGENNSLVTIVETTDDPTILGIVVLNPDGSRIGA